MPSRTSRGKPYSCRNSQRSHPPATTLETTGLLLYRLDQVGKELQKHLRSFLLCCREQWSRTQIEEEGPLYVSHLSACLQTSGQRSSQSQVGWAEPIAVQRLQN